MIYTAAAWIIKIFLILFYRFKVTGKQNLPNTGYVIACTHTGWLDVLVLGISIYPHKIYFMAKKELFENRFSRWLLTRLHAFPVDRQNPGPSSLKIPIRLLKNGKIIGIFPSGTRRTGDEDAPLKRGASYLAEKAQAPLIPAVYEGPPTISIKDLFKRKRIEVKIGMPIESHSGVSLSNTLNEKMNELKTQK